MTFFLPFFLSHFCKCLCCWALALVLYLCLCAVLTVCIYKSSPLSRTSVHLDCFCLVFFCCFFFFFFTLSHFPMPSLFVYAASGAYLGKISCTTSHLLTVWPKHSPASLHAAGIHRHACALAWTFTAPFIDFMLIHISHFWGVVYFIPFQTFN